MITLSGLDLAVAAVLVVGLALLSHRHRLGLGKKILIAALRTVVQLLLVGQVLRLVFALSNPFWMVLVAAVMLLAAGHEVQARQHRRLAGLAGLRVGFLSMFLSSFTVTLFGLAIIIQPLPWYAPQYAIPLLGMLLGNTMNGVALAMERVTGAVWQQKAVIEQRLLLGATPVEALLEIRRDAMRSGMIPIVNAMAAAGLVSLPGMMTGQILSGTPPIEAVKYQILIMFLIAGGCGVGILTALSLLTRLLFDDRARLRLDKLSRPG